MLKKIIAGISSLLIISSFCVTLAINDWYHGTNDQLFTDQKCSYSEYFDTEVSHYSGAKNSNGWVYSEQQPSWNWANAYAYGLWNGYDTRVAYLIHYGVTTDILSGG